MNPTIVALIFLLTSTGSPDSIIVNATVVQLERYPFAEPTGHLMDYYQLARICLVDTRDTLTVAFGYKITHGRDVKEILKLRKKMRFILRRKTASTRVTKLKSVGSKSDSIFSWLQTMPDTSIEMDSTLIPTKNGVWDVEKMSLP